MTETGPSALVLANCTHRSLMVALTRSGVFSRVESAELYSMDESRRTTLAEDVERFDLILTIEHGENFGQLATARLKERLGSRVYSLPTPFFSGTVPEMAYLSYEGSITRSAAVMGDYHSGLLLAELRAGYSTEQIVGRYVSGTAFERLDVEGIWAASLEELRQREKTAEITLSPFIEEAASRGEIGEQFLSFNHPREDLINHIARSFIQKATGQACSPALLTAQMHNLYADAIWPLHPVVAARLGLPQPTRLTFKQPDRMGGKIMEMDEFVRRSIAFFTTDKDPEKFRILSPSYLPTRIQEGRIAASASAVAPLPAGTTQTPDQEAGPTTMNKVNLIIIGTAKSGTTSLFDTLSGLPDVAASQIKEIAFFNRDAEYEKGISHYHGKFTVMDRRYVLDATPEYSARFEYPYVAQRIHDYNSDARLIFCVRDPIDRIASQYIHFSQVFPKAYPNPASCLNTVSGIRNITFRSLYNNSIKAFERLFPRENLFVFDLDEQQDYLGKLSTWLGIEIAQLSKANIRNAPGKRNPVYDELREMIRNSPYFDLIRDDAALFCERFGVGRTWATLAA